MYLEVMQPLFCYLVYVIAFEDLIYVYGQGSHEMQEQGRTQYQLLQERGNLPHYGNCWKDAIRHVDEGCRNLSEEKQSDIALHLTNCFLAMSGHDTYNCELNKKPNLRGICINSMSDRAFNVYTEFYTHTQNICWFLRGQIWHETISENTWKVGQQLEDSAKNQEQILENQKESLKLQEKLIEYGNALEKTMDKFYQSSKDHQEILSMFSSSLNNLQSWLLGEISWFDTIVFYIVASTLIVFFTSVPRTNNARLILLMILTLNSFIERLICYLLSKSFERDVRDIHMDYYVYVWYSRYFCLLVILVVLILTAVTYKNVLSYNNTLLKNIYDKVVNIANKIEVLELKSEGLSDNNISYVMENHKSTQNNIDKYLELTTSNLNMEKTLNIDDNRNLSRSVSSKNNLIIKDINDRKRYLATDSYNNIKYNLRSRNCTPELDV